MWWLVWKPLLMVRIIRLHPVILATLWKNRQFDTMLLIGQVLCCESRHPRVLPWMLFSLNDFSQCTDMTRQAKDTTFGSSCIFSFSTLCAFSLTNDSKEVTQKEKRERWIGKDVSEKSPGCMWIRHIAIYVRSTHLGFKGKLIFQFESGHLQQV